MSSVKKSKKIILYTLLTCLSLVFIFPILYMVYSSFKPSGELWQFSFKFKNLTLENYINAFSQRSFLLYIKNTLIVSVGATFVAVVINTMCGYALAKFRFKGDRAFISLIMATMMMPLVLVMTPVFVVLKTLGLYNTLWALIIPPAATPTGIFIMRQYLLTIPNELMEASRIDGAGEWKIFLRVILPLAKPAIATLTIFSFMWRWNDYIWPLIAINTPKKYTLQIVLSQFVGEHSVDWSGLLAMSTLTMIPLLIVFLFFQKQFIQGVASAGLKG